MAYMVVVKGKGPAALRAALRRRLTASIVLERHNSTLLRVEATTNADVTLYDWSIEHMPDGACLEIKEVD